MTVFGRDTAITSLQTLLLGPELAFGALEALADLQAHEDDASIDAEPGKIVHETREGRCAETWFPRYYGIGRLDAALPRAPRRDLALDRRLVVRAAPARPALLALQWIDRYGDRDGDGFVEYSRMVDSGLANQSWKDSGDSQRFHDGTLRQGADRGRRGAGLRLRRQARARGARAGGLARPRARRPARAQADELRARFDEAFWVEERGGFYALALDGDKQRVDSRCSNIGHLLWSGIVAAGARRRRSSTSCSPRSCGPAGASARWRATRPRSTRSATTTAPSGRTTRRSPPGVSRGTGTRPRRAAIGRALIEAAGALRLVAARGLRRLRARRDAVPDRLPDRRAPAGLGRGHADPARSGCCSGSSRTARGSGSSRR